MLSIKSSFEGGKLSLKNRLALPPMASKRPDEKGYVTDELIDYYRNMARSGLGLIITEHSFITLQGKAHDGQLSIASDDTVPGLTALAAAIHAEGSLAAVQISHAGSEARREVTGLESLGASCVAVAKRKSSDRPMEKSEILKAVELYADAARRTKAAGFDAVELHCAHGYLLNQFYSPLSNLRDDEYGGELKNRLRIHFEVIDAVRGAVGRDFPLIIRLGACDYIPGGSEIADAVEAAKLLTDAGIDIVDVSGGLSGYAIPHLLSRQGYFADESTAIKAACSAPVILTGGVTDSAAADKLIADGAADIIGVGRAMLQDSSWAVRALA